MSRKDQEEETEAVRKRDLTDLDGPCRSFLFSLRKDGTPTCHPMVAMLTNGRLTFNTYRASAKTQNLLRAPESASALLLQDWKVKPDKMLLVQGRIEPVENPATIMPAEGGEVRAGTGTLGEVSEERIKTARDRVASAKRIILELKPRANEGER